MLTPSENLIIPEDLKDDTVIWRYMDLAKFISLLQTSSLFFTRVDILLKEDRFEGYYSESDFKVILDRLIEYNKAVLPNYQINTDQVFSDICELLHYFILNMGVNSWMESEHQSLAMWKIYSKNNGIGIKSSAHKIMKSFISNNPYNRLILFNRVKYKNYKTYEIIEDKTALFEILSIIKDIELGVIKPEPDIYTKIVRTCLPLLYHKRRFFNYEQEFRFITPLLYDNNMPTQEGDYCKIDLNAVIDEIHLPPDTQKWFYNIVLGLLEQYGIDTTKLYHPDNICESIC